MKLKKEWWETTFNNNYLRADSYFASSARVSREIAFLLRIFHKIGLKKNAKILDFACGYGTHALALARHGFDVTGLDFSKNYIARARKNARKKKVKVSFLQKDMRNISFPRSFDAAICMYTSFGYFENENDHRKVLKQISRALKPRGVFILDLNNIARVLAQMGGEEKSEEKIRGVSVKKQFNPVTMRWSFDYAWREQGKLKRSRFRTRIFSLPELRYLLKEAGLKIKRVWGYYDESPYQFDSRRLIIFAQKV